MVTIRLTLDVDVDEKGIRDYRVEYPTLASLEESYAQLLIREAQAAWEWEGIATDVRSVEEAEDAVESEA